jgi:hypothetical protein
MTIDARFLAENLMSKVQFPDHTVAAEEPNDDRCTVPG